MSLRSLPQDPWTWVLTIYEGYEAVVTMESLSITLPLTELYAGVLKPATPQ
jgi:hypothetical protein